MWNSTTLWIILGIVVCLSILISWRLGKRRKTLWEKFARDLGLKYVETTTGIKVHGTLQDRDFQLITVASSSDTGAIGIEEVRMSLALHHPPPATVDILEAAGVLGELQRTTDPEAEPIGSQEFQQQTLVHGPQSPELRAYLSPARQQILMDFFEKNVTDLSGIQEGQIYLQQRSAITQLEELHQWCSLLQETAVQLDAAETENV